MSAAIREMTDQQRKLARHALGLGDGIKKSYRNRYCAALETEQEREWNVMAIHGFAVRDETQKRTVFFRLTERGARAALDRGETLDPEDFPPDLSQVSQEGK